ncbi:hypothetical protein [Streptomyces sp. RKAG337]|uniref:hypothetical protein n=1 Tax=Streptomyces sp. RKAG337 TaxID=2893404 RepID=UPI00203436F8|nr:hypothetical protein [Streptomyces sp. RKAG337]MCM2430995.1 hypothetical protein [Streptomyces sp. RKAG337]
METVIPDAVTAMDDARAALKESAREAVGSIAAVLACLYDEATYVTVHVRGGFASIGDVYLADGSRHGGPVRRGRPRFPPHLVGNWPLARLPKRVTRPHLGLHADDGDRTLNNLLTDAWRGGARFRDGYVGRHFATHLKLR